MWIKPSPFSSLGFGLLIYEIRKLEWMISSFSFNSVICLTCSKSNLSICFLCKDCKAECFFVPECISHHRSKPAWTIFLTYLASLDNSWLIWDWQGRRGEAAIHNEQMTWCKPAVFFLFPLWQTVFFFSFAQLGAPAPWSCRSGKGPGLLGLLLIAMIWWGKGVWCGVSSFWQETGLLDLSS